VGRIEVLFVHVDEEEEGAGWKKLANVGDLLKSARIISGTTI
jgi:hypothetical protein